MPIKFDSECYLTSGIVSESQVIYDKPCFYGGFHGPTGGANKTIILYDNATEAVGEEVENFVMDGNKATDGHERTRPVYCQNGIYLLNAGGASIVVNFTPVHTDIVFQY